MEGDGSVCRPLVSICNPVYQTATSMLEEQLLAHGITPRYVHAFRLLNSWLGRRFDRSAPRHRAAPGRATSQMSWEAIVSFVRNHGQGGEGLLMSERDDCLRHLTLSCDPAYIYGYIEGAMAAGASKVEVSILPSAGDETREATSELERDIRLCFDVTRQLGSIHPVRLQIIERFQECLGLLLILTVERETGDHH